MNGEVDVILPAAMAQYSHNERRFRVGAGSFRQVIENIYDQYPLLRQRITDRSGKLLPFLNVYLDSENIRDRPGLDFQVPTASTLLIVSAVAGG